MNNERREFTCLKRKVKTEGRESVESPWLLCFNSRDDGGEVAFYSASQPHRTFRDRDSPLSNKRIFNYSYGWILYHENQSGFMLFNLKTRQIIHLRHYSTLKRQYYINTGILWLPPENPMSKVLLFDENQTTILCYHISRKSWTELDYKKEAKKVVGDTSDAYLAIRHPVNYNDRLYAMLWFYKKVVEIDIVEGNGTQYLQIKPFKSDLPVIDIYKERFFSYNYKWWLAESRGELFAISVAGRVPYAKAIDVRVLRWDLQGYWRYVKGSEIKDRAFFLSDNSEPISCTTMEHEFEGGRVYYISSSCKRTYSYDVEDGSMTTPMSLPSMFLDPSVWVMLPNPMEDREEMKKKKKTNTKSYLECKRVNFHDLTYDIMETVTKKIRPVDCMNLRGTCKACCQLTPKIRWWRTVSLGQVQPQYSLRLPWFMFSRGDHTVHHFIDMKFGGTFTIEANRLLYGSKILHSKNGWVLMMTTNTHDENNLFFYNPFSHEVIKLPEAPEHDTDYDRLCFTDIPTSSECIVMGVTFNSVCYFDMTQQCWRYNTLSNKHEPSIDNTPVFFKGAFYLLSTTGVFYKLVFQDGRLAARVRSYEGPSTNFYQNFLLEWDGKVAAVFINEEWTELQVYTLHETTMTWERVSDLGGSSFFLSSSSAFSITTHVPELDNKIYLSKIYEEDKIIFYCLKTKRFGYTTSEENINNFEGTKEYLSACWIQPNCSTTSR